MTPVLWKRKVRLWEARGSDPPSSGEGFGTFPLLGVPKEPPLPRSWLSGYRIL